MKIDYRLEQVFIKCSSCSICIGPKFLTKDFYDVGPSKLCPSCFKDLNKDGFLYLDDKSNGMIEIMQLDGTKATVSKKERF